MAMESNTSEVMHNYGAIYQLQILEGKFQTGVAKADRK